MRVATLMMTRMLCSMTISVTPSSRSRPISATRPGIDRWSTPPVTSSSRRSRGRVAIARAISRRFRCPVESSRAKAPALSASPTSARQRSASTRAAPVDAARGERAHGDVLPHRHAAERAELLERPADAPAVDLIRPEAGERLAGEADLPAVRPVEAGDHVEERRLPGAVRPDDADDLARRHVERDALVRHEAAEALGHAADLQQGSPAPPRLAPSTCGVDARSIAPPAIRCPGARRPASGPPVLPGGGRAGRRAPRGRPAGRPRPGR